MASEDPFRRRFELALLILQENGQKIFALFMANTMAIGIGYLGDACSIPRACNSKFAIAFQSPLLGF